MFSTKASDSIIFVYVYIQILRSIGLHEGQHQEFDVQAIGKKSEDDLVEFKKTGDESLKLKLEDVIKIIKEEKAKY